MVIIAIAGLIFGVSEIHKKTGGSNGIQADIYRSGSIIETINLDDQVALRNITLSSDNDKYHYSISVEAGRIRFHTADCPDEICVNTGWLDSVGETAACIPGNMLIKVTGKEE